jgi:hypothetical protein
VPRTNDTLVGGVIEVDTDIGLTPFINSANRLVTQLCAPSGYDEDTLTDIETWLAAHFYAVRDPRESQVGASGLTAQYGGRFDLGFDFTQYGQQAMRLDTAGNLAALNNRMKKATMSKKGITWLGTDAAGILGI